MGRYSGILGSGRYAGVLSSAGGGAWEDVSPTAQRRKKADGSYEYRPRAKFAGAEPGLAGETESPALPYGAPNLDELKFLGGQAASRVKEGVTSFTDLPDLASAAIEQLLPAGVTVKPGAREEAFRLPGVAGEVRDSVSREYSAAKDQLAGRLTDRGLSPLAIATADTGLEAAAAVADPTNFLPSVGALKAGKRMGRYAGLADDVLKAAPPPSVLDDVLEEAVERGPLKAPDPELRARFPEAEIDTRDVFEGPMLPTGTRNRLPPVDIREGGRDVRAFDISTGRYSVVPEEAAGPLPAFRDDAAAALEREAVERAVAADAPVPAPLLAKHPDLAADVMVAGAAGERGFLKIPAGGPSFLGRWFTKDGEFHALGELKGWAFDRSNARNFEIAAGGRQVTDNLRDFSVAFEEAMPQMGGKTRDEVADYLMAGLRGDHDLRGVPPKLRDAVGAMRAHLDELSGGYLPYEDLSARMRQTIQENEGAYVPRAFQAFEDPDFPARVDPLSPKHDPKEAWRWEGFMKWAQGQREADAAQVYPGATVLLPDGRQGKVSRVGITARDAMRQVQQSPEIQGFPVPGVQSQDELEKLVRQTTSPQAVRIWDEWRNGPRTPEAYQGALDEMRRVRGEESVRLWASTRDQPAVRKKALEARRELRNQRFEELREKESARVAVEFEDGSVEEVARAELKNTAGTATWTDDEIAAYGQRLLYRDPDAFLATAAGSVGRENRGNLAARIIARPTVDDLPESIAKEVRQGRLSLEAAAERARAVPGWWESYVAQQEGLPREIDDLLGLYRDPAMRYRAGAIRAVHDQAVYKMHRDLRDRGLAAGIFVPEAPGRPGQFVRIGGKGPLADMHASPEVAAVVRGTENAAKQVSSWWAGWQKLNGGVKLAKTALNFPGGDMRNLVAWVPQLMAGGHFVAAFNPARAVKLLPYQLADKLGTKRGALTRLAKRLADSVELADGTRLGERWAMKLQELRSEIDFLYRQGVFGESAHADDLRHYTGVLGIKEEKPRGKVLKAGLDAAVGFWSGGDDLGKHIYYRAELQNLLWANGKIKALETLPADYFTRPAFRAEAEEAARRVRLVTPTSSMIAPGVKKLRDAPIAAFPGWTAEVFRNAKEQIRLGVLDLRNPNPRMKVLGAKRLAGLLGTSAAASAYGIGKAFDATSGVQEPEAIRSFVPPWSVDSQLAVTELDVKSGKVRYVDLSALIPQAAYMDSASTILRSVQDPTDDGWDAAIDAIQGGIQPFVEEEIVVTAMLDWLRNSQMKGGGVPQALNMLRNHERKMDGYEVYTPGAMTKTQAKQTIYHFYKAAAPAGVIGLQGERLLRAAFKDNPEVRAAFAELTNYDRELEVEDELWGMAGLRFSTIDVGRSLARQGSDYTRRRTDASALYGRRKKMGPGQMAHPELVIKAKEEANAMGRAAHEQMARVVADALRLGFPPHQVRRWLKDGNIATKHVTALMLDAQRLQKGEEPASYIPVVR
ncbi:MAG TPA: hypothetical protein VJ725_21440 [Thermoanaerobaculia bacterium]|nr:hypothetical protein [Thermoanaerobaculia bacterium]